MKFCSQCATQLQFILPPDDHIKRHVCPNCHFIHYQNPRLIVGTLPVFEGKILLCRRGIEPKQGFWTIPGGFMENGESTVEGAKRESIEEAGININVGQLLSNISLPQYDQVHQFYFATMLDDAFTLTPESTEIRLFDIKDIPWQDIAFKTVVATLKHYIKHKTALSNQQPVPLLDEAIILEDHR